MLQSHDVDEKEVKAKQGSVQVKESSLPPPEGEAREIGQKSSELVSLMLTKNKKGL